MRLPWFLIPAAGILLLAAGFFFIASRQEPPRDFGRPSGSASRGPSGNSGEAGDPLPAAVHERLRPGDIILRRGTSFVSTMIVEVLGDPPGFSHCGVLVPAGPEEGGGGSAGWDVIHSVSRSLSDQDGVQREALETFVLNSVPGTTAVVRLRDGHAPIDSDLAARARNLLTQGHGFDNFFRLGTAGGVYCSELLWLILPPEVRTETMVFHEPGHIIRFESFLDEHFYEMVYEGR